MRLSLAIALALSLLSLRLHGQQLAHCTEAERFLAEDRRMAVKTEPDTIDDWRTGTRQAGCRITAAGLTDIGLASEVSRFYQRLQESGWTRTPDPRDAPRESSVRFRKAGSDCLFNLYEGALLLTDAEREVSSARIPAAGQSRYGVFVFCMTALPSKPREDGRRIGAAR
jgi:hypothetical protein